MATYAIGDVQGCYSSLMLLLDKIKFDDTSDNLWFAGDIVNRGPSSLKTIQFIRSLGDRAITVLGNHDLHLVAMSHGVRSPGKHDTINDILKSEQREEIIQWLLSKPLVHYDDHLAFTMVHAGIPPQWDISTALKRSKEVELIFANPNSASEFMKHMYGNKPARWKKSLEGWDRCRLIVNYFTRMRFCKENGKLELLTTGKIHDAPPDYGPWFKFEKRKTSEDRIVFGHWAALEGNTETANAYALDTGCVWGKTLTALRLDDLKYFSVDSIM